ncbi:acyl-CoA carboxylase subunit beta [Nocardia tengchongensis]|uniref:acyl-CoA carboxylase subunit beta n=1 Tax=Nocardia tengchongensis TaxID=2055889 RepID=UPI00369A387B
MTLTPEHTHRIAPVDDRAATPDMRSLIDRRQRLQHDLETGADPRAATRQHAGGKLTVRERIELLLDQDSFVEVEPLRRHRASGFGLDKTRPHTDGVVTGWGTVDGRTVFLYGHDFRIFGGSLGEAHAEKIHKIMDMAASVGAPLISLCDGAGARIQEGVTALAGYGGIFRRNVDYSGVIPQISVILGPCAGGAAYSAALTDFVFMVRGISQMYVTGPDVITAVTGERITHEQLGGADVHAGTSGVAHHAYDDEQQCLEDLRHLLTYLPSNNRELPPQRPTRDPVHRVNTALVDLVPTDPSHPYDMRTLIAEIVDDHAFFELNEAWATNVVCALAHIGGQPVGIIANQPTVLAGTLDIDASQKAARFVTFCDAFNIALITVVDVPGFLPGVVQEHNGIIRHGAKLLYAYCEASVPRIQLIVRKAYGGAYIVMDSRAVGADLSFAWPGNEIAVMGAEAAANVIFRRELATAEDPDASRAHYAARYREELAHPYYAAERGLVDDVIDPASTRHTLARALNMLRSKHATLPERKHGIRPM